MHGYSCAIRVSHLNRSNPWQRSATPSHQRMEATKNRNEGFGGEMDLFIQPRIKPNFVGNKAAA